MSTIFRKLRMLWKQIHQQQTLWLCLYPMSIEFIQTVYLEPGWTGIYDMAYSWSKCLPFAHTHGRRRPHHLSNALSMTVWSMPCQTCRKCCFSWQPLFRPKLSYRKQIAHQLRTQYVEGIYDNPMTLKSRLTVTQDHWKGHGTIG